MRHEFIKTRFTMVEYEVVECLKQKLNPETDEPRNKIVLYGCESHKSIRQTCLDLLAKGYKVTLVEDALGFKN